MAADSASDIFLTASPGNRDRFYFLKLNPEKYPLFHLPQWTLKPLPGMEECQQSYPASIWDLIFSMKPKRGRMVRKEAAVLGGLAGNPGDAHFFLLNSLVKPFEIYSWKVLQKRLALLIKAFISFLLGRRWNVAESVCCPNSYKDVGP